MIVRLVAVALAFVITGGPALTITCQATCAERETAAAPSGNHQQHSCHTATSSKGVAIIGVPHICGHSDTSEVGTNQSVKPFATSALVAIDIAFAAPVLQATRISFARAEHSPPGSVSQINQLRI
jgi:hypothetical protein